MFTNPGPKTIVTAKDRVFVLGKDIPKDFIIDFSKKGNLEQSKNSNKVEDPKSVSPGETVNGSQAMTKDFYGLKQVNTLFQNQNGIQETSITPS